MSLLYSMLLRVGVYLWVCLSIRVWVCMDECIRVLNKLDLYPLCPTSLKTVFTVQAQRTVK